MILIIYLKFKPEHNFKHMMVCIIVKYNNFIEICILLLLFNFISKTIKNV